MYKNRAYLLHPLSTEGERCLRRVFAIGARNKESIFVPDCRLEALILDP